MLMMMIMMMVIMMMVMVIMMMITRHDMVGLHLHYSICEALGIEMTEK
jgi:hypothetical protein